MSSTVEWAGWCWSTDGKIRGNREGRKFMDHIKSLLRPVESLWLWMKVEARWGDSEL